MREIIRAILASPVPVATFVHPSGARAASAGTYVLYASHIAAMTPGTNVGAATPIALGGLPSAPPEDPTAPPKGPRDTADRPRPEQARSAIEAKAVNDAVAFLRALAELRGRNAEWAEQAVREAASLSANQALAADVIDILATSLEDLLAQMHGRTVLVGQTQVTLDTRTLVVEQIRPDWRTRLLAAITNPNVALLLMMVGLYGLIFEFMNPGALYPGVIGAIALLVGLYALAALPVNVVGAGLVLLGVALLAVEAFTPSFGILGIGGAIALGLGLTIVIDADLPEFRVAWPVVGALVASAVAFTAILMPLAWRAHRRRVVSGREQLAGARGRVADWEDGHGHVVVLGERWNAVSAAPLQPGHPVRVARVDGLTLTVVPDTGATDVSH
jgi:membrane-bound serine protease (ClpP class)